MAEAISREEETVGSVAAHRFPPQGQHGTNRCADQHPLAVVGQAVDVPVMGHCQIRFYHGGRH
jgi:hypothetical protein